MADPFRPVGPPADNKNGEDKAPASRKLFWFAILALAGLAATAGAAYLLRALLFIE